MTKYPDLPQEDGPRSNEMRSLKDAISPRLLKALAELGGNLPPVDEPTYACGVCEDRGLVKFNVPIDHPAFGKLYACEHCEKGREMFLKRWSAQLRNARMPSLYQHSSLLSFAALPEEAKDGKRRAYIAASLFVESEDHSVSLGEVHERAGLPVHDTAVRNSLVFQGPLGVGKTWMAAAVVNELAAMGRASLYMRTQDFLDTITSRFKAEEPPSSFDVVQLLVNAPVLVLDEFNVNIVGEWLQGQMETVIRSRAANERATIVTCNANANELTEMWGARTVDVLLSMSHWIAMGGQVLRQQRQDSMVY